MTMKTELPEEIIALEILARLPAKSLMRFKCVSKSWYALFQNPDFINSHRVFHSNPRLLVNGVKRGEEGMLSIFVDETLELQAYFNLLLPLTHHEGGGTTYTVQLVSSCSVNGIICLLTDNSTVTIMNPATRESKDATRPSDPSSCGIYYKNYGFGYDPITDDYKVVGLVWRFDYDPLSGKRSLYQVVEVYSLRSDCWRKLDAAIDWGMKGGYSCCSVFANGMIHWLSNNKKSYDTKILLSFDVSTEIFYTTVLPRQKEYIQLARVKESIAILTGRHIGLGKCFDVWILGEVGAKDSWTKHFTVGPFLDLLSPIGAGENGEIFFKKALYGPLDKDKMVSLNEAELVCYDPNTQMFRNLGLTMFNNGLAMFRFGKSAVTIYSESIVSLQMHPNISPI